MPESPARIGIVTVSDRASQGVYEDRGGPAIRDYLTEILSSPWEIVARIIPDERSVIEQTLIELCDRDGCCLVVTTGGTGPARRDVTPEATLAVCEKEMPGFGELMRKVSLEKVPTAILSRQTAGIRGGTLIINLPGQPKAIRECLGAVFPAIPYSIDLLDGPYLSTDETKLTENRPMIFLRPECEPVSNGVGIGCRATCWTWCSFIRREMISTCWSRPMCSVCCRSIGNVA
jgi:molybdopterin adenylyltransferase